MFSLIEKIVEGILARITGPLHFRFILQPIMAVILGIRDGHTDFQTGTPPFIVNLIFSRQNRKKNLKNTFKRLMIPIIIGTVIDMVAQHFIFERIRLVPAFVVGVFIMAIPYTLARGITNRLVLFKNRKKSK